MADNVIAKNEPTVFVPPPEGDFPAVLVDVIDLGMCPTKNWGAKWKIALLFQIDCVNEETGARYVLAERFTNSMNEKSALRKFLGQWRGRPYSDDQANAGVPLSSLVGQKAMVTVVHNQVGDKVYANVFTIRRRSPGDPDITADPYERSPRWAEKRQEAAGGKLAPPATNQPVARDPGRQSIKPAPRPPIFQGAAQAAGPGITDHDVEPDESTWPGAEFDEHDEAPF